MPKVLATLLQSRKFWMALITAIATFILFLTGHVNADTLADTLVILSGIVIAAIALEDSAKKFTKRDQAK